MWLFQPRFPLSIKTPCDMYSFDYIIKNLPVGVVSLPPIPLWENESPSHRRGLSEETSPAAGWCCWTRTQAALCTGKGADGQPWRCVCVLAVGGNKWFSHTHSLQPPVWIYTEDWSHTWNRAEDEKTSANRCQRLFLQPDLKMGVGFYF